VSTVVKNVSQFPGRGGNSGISLIELVAAAGIIAVLAILLLPQFQRLKGAGAGVTGTKNAASLVAGGIAYANDHNGNFPTTEWNYEDLSRSTRWVSELAPYVYADGKTMAHGSPMVDGTFRCPLLRGYKKYGNSWQEWGWDSVDWINVATVRYENGNYGTPNLMKGRLSTMPFVVSTDRNDIGAGGLVQYFPASFPIVVPREVWVFGGGVITGYCDGHVETISEPTPAKIFKGPVD
jgi:prepilin-type processing-associated H-X9-DG protein